jgi:hypothetical protein
VPAASDGEMVHFPPISARASRQQGGGAVVFEPNSSYNICRVDCLLSILLSPA